MRTHLTLFACSLLACIGIVSYSSHTYRADTHARVKYHCQECGSIASLNDISSFAPDPTKDMRSNYRDILTRIDRSTVIPTLYTPRLTLRPVTMDDLDDTYSYSSSYQVARSMTWKRHKTIDKTKRLIKKWIEGYARGESGPWAIVETKTGTFLGTMTLHSYNPTHKTIMFGNNIDTPYWGRGFGTEALRALIEYAFKYTPLRVIYAICRNDNIGSWRVMEKVGMHHAATYRHYWNNKEELLTMHEFEICKDDVMKNGKA